MKLHLAVVPILPLLQLSSLRELKASSSTQLEDQEHLVRGLEAKVAERDERIGEIQAQAHSFSREVDNLRSVKEGNTVLQCIHMYVLASML